jgi:hypothetical protein
MGKKSKATALGTMPIRSGLGKWCLQVTALPTDWDGPPAVPVEHFETEAHARHYAGRLSDQPGYSDRTIYVVRPDGQRYLFVKQPRE